MKDIAILSSVRTAIGKGIKGTLKDVRPDTFGAVVVKEAILRAGINPTDVSDVVMGCAMPEAEQGMNVARSIAFLAGLPYTSSAVTVNRFCSSGLHAIADVAKAIHVNQYQIGVGGGVESMSLVPMGGHKLSINPVLMQNYPAANTPMGITAENVAKKYDISRQAQDDFSMESHRRASLAIKNGWFDDEIVPFDADIFSEDGIKKTVRFCKDEGPRVDTTIAALEKLKTVFDKSGTVTAGNASQLSDGAAAAVLMDAKDAQAAQYKIMGYFRGFVTAGVPPDMMGIGPVPAIRKLLVHMGLKIDEIGVFEINEAFAAQVVYSIRELGLDPAKVNPCGGAIALGHPLGCTGARQVATILREMKRRRAKYGVVSMCVGGGMGAAGLIELKQ
jgi:acetyl-CoA acyltransferase